MRDELGITEVLRARPIQAAVASAAAFSVGAAIPILAAVLAPSPSLSIITTIVTMVALGVLGGLAAWAGGASVVKGTLRVMFWGAAAMAITALVGRLFGANV